MIRYGGSPISAPPGVSVGKVAAESSRRALTRSYGTWEGFSQVLLTNRLTAMAPQQEPRPVHILPFFPNETECRRRDLNPHALAGNGF